MAKKKTARGTRGKVNKSKAIKQYLADHPDAPPSEVVESLRRKGVKVTAAYVSTIKSSQKTESTRRKRKTGKTSDNGSTAAEDMWKAGGLMMQAIDLVIKAGAKEAKMMVDLAGKMAEKLREEK